MQYNPHGYQVTAENRIIDTPKLGLFLDMGLGKTVVTLSAIKRLMFDSFEVKKVLVIAPKRVAEDTWSRECEKWDHLHDLRISKILGNPTQREAGLRADADVYVINRENTKWLIDRCRTMRSWPFDMLVIDELSSFKACSSQRFKALKTVTPLLKRVVGLTGTPSPNSLMDLWPQVYLLDRGERLERTIGRYREKYFTPGRRNGYAVFNWDLNPGADKIIQERISDICVSMSAADYLTLPERIDNIVSVKLTASERKIYEDFEKEQVMSIDGSEGIVATTAAIVSNKLLQMANGAVYDVEGKAVHCHDEKLDALEEILDCNDEPVLVFYNFKHDRERLRERFAKYSPGELNTSDDIAKWNRGETRLLLAHPASVGHGLNIQAGGHTIVWFGLTWSLELYQQANARLYRQGQQKAVVIHHLVAEGTVDEDVMRAIERKNLGQAALLNSIKARRDSYEQIS